MLNRGYSYKEVLNKRAVGHTALSYLVHFYPHSSPETWQERFDNQEILLDNGVAKTSDNLQSGQTLLWNRPPWVEGPVPMDYGILYQDEDILLVNKPSGLPTMPAGGFLENTLFSMVHKIFPTASPIHRLGRGTSGLVAFTLNVRANRFLSEQWRKRQVRKIYTALAQGVALESTYHMSQAIGGVEHSRLGQVYAACNHGKPAFSVATVLERFSECTLFEVDLKSGRPHQIRIHLASVGHPLVGDPLYGIGGQIKTDALPGDGGYFLHAQKLEFIHPNHHPLSICAPIPETFEDIIKKARGTLEPFHLETTEPT
jgi:23S rRNA pseudouridine1911/1915/1917 synthase